MKTVQTNWDKLSFPRLCGLLAGNPSSLSQAMHNAGFKALGIDFIYSAFSTVDTEHALKSCRELGFRGLSLTIPHKEAAMHLVDKLSDEAKKIGSINTVINDGEYLHGINTDYFGIIQALKEVNFTSTQALVIGAGGASRGALYALQQMGVEKIKICNRSADRAIKLAKEFQVEYLELESISKWITSNSCLVVNSTPATELFDLESISSKHTVFDMITSETQLIRKAKENGAQVVPGIRMLLHQALMQFELFTEQTAPKDVMEKALLSST